ncbi:thiamine pyrophosphate-dependent enzyme [Streptomyces sparsogenes]|uniref:thiamine pyrophosphate-dependent enzyme n=1 Tax=Streptomyces sparsogenes TaxID=67365 RepID=UPI0038503500
MRAALSHGLAAPGASVPYAVAARLAFPDRPVIALVGDGALQTSGLNELITVRGHLGRFADILGGKGPVVLEFVVDGETAPDWAEEAQRGHPAARSVRRLPRGRLRRLIGTVGGGLSGP